MAPLGLCAAKQILIYGKKTFTTEEEIQYKNFKDSPNKFDSSGREELTDKELFNVLKSNKINISQDQV